jgi:hypothetical protein
MAQVPRGDEGMICPDFQQPMSEVCHKCPLWMKLPVKDPTTNTDIDEWKCAKIWSVLLQFHNCRETMMVSKEVNVLRNETKKAHDEHLAMGAAAVHQARQAVREAITWGPASKEVDKPLALIDSTEGGI